VPCELGVWGSGIRPRIVRTAITAVLAAALQAHAFRPPELSKAQQDDLRRNFAPCLSKIKGPYTENYCICPNGQKLPVQVNSRVTSPCGPGALFCSAYRAPWAEALARQRMWIANLFARDLYQWDTFTDHHDLVRGYILEKYFTETNPTHKLAEMHAYGGLAGAEYEAAAAPRFFERYLSLPDYDDARHYILAYELQRRYYVRDDQGQIQKVRAIAVRLQQADPKFKPLRDATHNQISATLIPKLEAYRDANTGALRSQTDDLIVEIRKLTSLDPGVLRAQLVALDDKALGAELVGGLPGENTDPVDTLAAYAAIMARARRTVAARTATPSDRRRLVDAAITAAALIQKDGSRWLGEKGQTARQHLRVLAALTDAAYGTGLLGERERAEAARNITAMADASSLPQAELAAGMKRVERVVEWAQQNAIVAFAEVSAPWMYLLPQVSGIGDDVVRGSPLLIFADVATRLDDAAGGRATLKHDVFGASPETGVRSLNPGLAMGRLRVGPPEGGYARDEVVVLPETPADLEPAAGIVTQGEGNVLSHVQLLARALGIPNVVIDPAVYRKIASHDGRDVFFLATPRGRVVLKDKATMSPQEQSVYDEYTGNERRMADGSLKAASAKLHIDRAKLDVTTKAPRDLSTVRRSDSGRLCGPKAAFLGELKYLFPDHVARGVVVPFGAYYDHYQHAPVAVPESVRKLNIATPGEPLPTFVERTYATFFGQLIPAKKSERELAAWISPRLDVIQYSIRQALLSAELRDGIRNELDRVGLLTGPDKRDTVGCFVRSDTNVEDLDNFNGAGLNLTLFNQKSLDDIYDGLKEVWASPFGYRSFSWRQTLIDEPLWVMPSVVILESVPSEKSGVLVTGDTETGDRGKMLVATSEGVGGAVDGTPAETLLWSPTGVDLVTSFKSPWRRMLQPGGSSAIVASTGRDHVLEPRELEDLVAAGRRANDTIDPARDPAGMPRPWDIEFGFVGGKLWLFQCRPFVGNDALKNVTALATLEAPAVKGSDMIALEEKLK
jgi:hypothetical protein